MQLVSIGADFIDEDNGTHCVHVYGVRDTSHRILTVWHLWDLIEKEGPVNPDALSEDWLRPGVNYYLKEEE